MTLKVSPWADSSKVIAAAVEAGEEATVDVKAENFCPFNASHNGHGDN
jgi:hypothetical protein